MIKGRDEANLLRQQHAVAKDVAAHIPDAGDRKRLFLRVHAHLVEVALDRLPAAACRDAHLLVVIADGPARRESVVEPEAVFGGQAVRDVGKSRRTLVGSHDQVRVVAIPADDSLGGYDLTVDDVVGDVEKPTNKRLVAAHAVVVDRVAVVGRGLLGIEAALGARGHDDGVLDHLGFHQAKHLGTKILAAIRPAQAAAGNRAKTQVHALDFR